MSLDASREIQSSGKELEAASNNTRVLLLLGCFMVMIFSWGPPGNAAPRVVALLASALVTGVALLRPQDTRDVAQLRRAEQVLISLLLLAGLIMTASFLAEAFVNLAPPVRVASIALYVFLGLVGAMPMSRRLPHLRWAFPLFLVVHAAVTVTFLRSVQAPIDVQVFLHDGAGALLHGQNPYSMTFPNIYRSPFTEMFYGPGVVVDGRITYGFPYMPVSLLGAILGQLLGDVRYAQLIALLLTAVVLRRLASDRLGRASAVLAVAAPAAIPVVGGAWTEPTLVALLACLVLALARRRLALGAVLLGLLLVSKQYVVVTIPVISLIRQSLTRRLIFISIGVGAAVTLPFLLLNPTAFWKAIVEFQLIQPFRSDSMSLLVSSVNTFGWPPPWTYGVLPLAGGALTATALALRAPRTPAAFAAGVGLTLLVTILLSKQAFMNYYFLVSGAFLIAAVAWPTQPLTANAPLGKTDA